MNDENNLEFAYTMLGQHGITPQKIFFEILRVLKVKSILEKENDKEVYDEDYIYEIMKKHTVGNFPGDKQFFLQFYNVAKDIDILDFINFYTIRTANKRTRIINNNNIFTTISSYFKNVINKYSVKSVLFLEAEKFLSELPDLIEQFRDIHFFLTTGDGVVYNALQLAFDGNENVEISRFTITSEYGDIPSADLNISMNILYTLRDGNWFLMRGLDTIWNRIVKRLKPDSIYCFLFLNELFGSDLDNFQEHLLSNYHILSVNNIYLKRGYGYINRTVNIIEIKNSMPPKKYDIEIKKWTMREGDYKVESQMDIRNDNLKNYTKWEFDHINDMMHSHIIKYKNSKLQKIKLGNIASVSRGRFIKPHSSTGDTNDVITVYKLTISAIVNGNIDNSKLIKIDIPQDQYEYLSRSIVKLNDLIISCRGSLFKMAIFNESSIKAVIDANLILIRPNSEYDSRYIKLFFESEIGKSIIKSIDTNGVILSISPKSLENIEIPQMSLKAQKALIKRYETAMKEYKTKIQEARDNFEKARSEIEKSIFKDIL